MEKENNTSKMLLPAHKEDEYKAWIAGLVEQFRQGQVKAVIHVNRELLLFYWCLGCDINEFQKSHNLWENLWSFAFISREHHLMFGSTDKFVDLLFYQIPMHRYDAVEVNGWTKICNFIGLKDFII